MEKEWENNAPEEDKATRKTRKKISTPQNENFKFPYEKIPYTPRGSLQWNDDEDNDDDDDEVENESVVGHGKGTSPEEDKATRKTRKMINTLQDKTYKFPSEKIPYKPRGSLQLNDDNDNDEDDEIENDSGVGHGKGTSLIADAEIKNFLENRLATLTAEVSMNSIMIFNIDSGVISKLTDVLSSSPRTSRAMWCRFSVRGIHQAIKEL